MVRIITDSAADFNPDELKSLNITCVPLSIIFGETEYRENIDISKEEFYQKLKQSEDFPRTSQPSPDSFMNALKEAMDNGEAAVVITLSSALSGTYQSAVLAKNMLEYENCYIVDSLSATAGQRLLVEHAATLRDEGKTGAEIASKIEAIRSKVTIYACIDTLEYLHKGGRISGVSYAVGSIANIKPIIHVSKEGKVEIPSKVMGKNKALKHLANIVEEIKPDTSYPMVVVYSDDRTNADSLVEIMKNKGYEITDNHIANIGAAIGTHVGPNAFGVIYIAK